MVSYQNEDEARGAILGTAFRSGLKVTIGHSPLGSVPPGPCRRASQEGESDQLCRPSANRECSCHFDTTNTPPALHARASRSF